MSDMTGFQKVSQFFRECGNLPKTTCEIMAGTGLGRSQVSQVLHVSHKRNFTKKLSVGCSRKREWRMTCQNYDSIELTALRAQLAAALAERDEAIKKLATIFANTDHVGMGRTVDGVCENAIRWHDQLVTLEEERDAARADHAKDLREIVEESNLIAKAMEAGSVGYATQLALASSRRVLDRLAAIEGGWT